MNFKNPAILLLIISAFFLIQSSYADTIYCPASLLCMTDIHNNLVCTSQDNSNFSNWRVFDGPSNLNSTKFMLTNAQIPGPGNGQFPMCIYSTIGAHVGLPLTIVSFNKYFSAGSNWQNIGTPAHPFFTCPVNDGIRTLIMPQTCPFSTTSNEKKE